METGRREGSQFHCCNEVSELFIPHVNPRFILLILELRNKIKYEVTRARRHGRGLLEKIVFLAGYNAFWVLTIHRRENTNPTPINNLT